MRWRVLLAGCLAALSVAPGAAMAHVAAITIEPAGGVAISPLLYGANYVWDRVPDREFDDFRTAMAEVAKVTLLRYLGGWGAETYNWEDNTETGDGAYVSAGARPDEVLDAVPVATFITPSKFAVADPARIAEVTRESAALVAKYGARVKYWEVGNEWWLQGGAKQNPEKRARNLENYSALLASVVPAMKAADPSIKIFATVDWPAPQDLAQMRQVAGAAWADVDGISVHSYCGTLDPHRLCAGLPAGMEAVRAAAGKDLIYASEWCVTKGMNLNDDGIHNAALTVGALQDMAFAKIQLAAYWPPILNVDSVAFVSNHYQANATGVVFGWMSQYYEGEALRTYGDLPAVAARDGVGLTVIVPSGDSGPVDVRIALAGTGLSGVVSAAVLYADENEVGPAGRLAHVTDLPAAVHDEGGAAYVEFSLNPGGAGRGAGDEIARVTMR